MKVTEKESIIDWKILPRSKVEELVRQFVVDKEIHAVYGKDSEGLFIVHFLVQEEVN
jgi:hypothetical protein